jgi:hypothetical protein
MAQRVYGCARDDLGSGACEIVWVKSVEANPE